MEKHALKQLANFLFEAGHLQKTPRSGFQLLGSGSQSVAEHINRASYIGFVLAKMNGNVDSGKVVQMCMFHDFAEARGSDLNYLQQKYNERHEEKAIADLTANHPFGNDILAIINEYEERQSVESLLVKDADNLELLLFLKDQADIGTQRAMSWIPSLLGRLKTDEGRELAQTILETSSDEWWFGNKNDSWWTNRDKQTA